MALFHCDGVLFTIVKLLDASIQTRQFGSRLKALRRESGLTLKGLSARSGLSIGLLSELERGQGNPSLTTISRIASAMGVQIGLFFPDSIQRQRVVRKDERKLLELSEPGLKYELLTPDLTGQIELLWIELPPMYSGQDHPFTHEGEETGIVLQGELEVHIGEEVYHLETGDSITYLCNVPHWSRNLSRKPTILVWAISPPSF